MLEPRNKTFAQLFFTMLVLTFFVALPAQAQEAKDHSETCKFQFDHFYYQLALPHSSEFGRTGNQSPARPAALKWAREPLEKSPNKRIAEMGVTAFYIYSQREGTQTNFAQLIRNQLLRRSTPEEEKILEGLAGVAVERSESWRVDTHDAEILAKHHLVTLTTDMHYIAARSANGDRILGMVGISQLNQNPIYLFCH